MKKNVLMLVFVMAGLLAGCASDRPATSSADMLTSSDQTDTQRRALVRLQLAVGYYQQGELKIALDEVKQALQVDPNLADAHSVRGLLYMDLKELKLAEESFLRALALNPNNPDFSNNYGWFLCQNGREAKSIAYFDAALNNRLYKSPAKALNNAGVCSLKTKNESAALQYFTQAFQYEPNNPLTNTNLARIYYDRQEYERARFYIARVPKADELNADVLWLAIKIERKVGDRAAESSLITQLRRRHPNSPEYAAFKRGAFDE